MYVTPEADIPYCPGALPPYILEANQHFRSRCWVRVPVGESPWWAHRVKYSVPTLGRRVSLITGSVKGRYGRPGRIGCFL